MRLSASITPTTPCALTKPLPHRLPSPAACSPREPPAITPMRKRFRPISRAICCVSRARRFASPSPPRSSETPNSAVIVVSITLRERSFSTLRLRSGLAATHRTLRLVSIEFLHDRRASVVIFHSYRSPSRIGLTLTSRLPYNQRVSAPPNLPVGAWARLHSSSQLISGCPEQFAARSRSPLVHLRNSRSSSRSYINLMKRTLAGTAVLAVVLTISALAQTGSAAPGGAPAPPAAPTTAATSGGVKIGIVDIQQAIVATNEGARDFEALQKKFEPRRSELQNLNTEVENLKKQLNTQGDKMNEEARATLVKSIETKQKSLQRSAEDAQNEFQAQQNEIAQRILQKMAPVIDKYAKSNGYGLLLDSSNPWPQGPLLWATASVDVTKIIVDAYNAQSGVAAPAAAKPAGTAATKPAATKPATTP